MMVFTTLLAFIFVWSGLIWSDFYFWIVNWLIELINCLNGLINWIRVRVLQGLWSCDDQLFDGSLYLLHLCHIQTTLRFRSCSNWSIDFIMNRFCCWKCGSPPSERSLTNLILSNIKIYVFVDPPLLLCVCNHLLPLAGWVSDLGNQLPRSRNLRLSRCSYFIYFIHPTISILDDKNWVFSILIPYGSLLITLVITMKYPTIAREQYMAKLENSNSSPRSSSNMSINQPLISQYDDIKQ